jgi:hypothetical protein
VPAYKSPAMPTTLSILPKFSFFSPFINILTFKFPTIFSKRLSILTFQNYQ